MFICQDCKQVKPSRTSEIKVVVEEREKPYHGGREIVKELVLCSTCASKSRRVELVPD